MKCIACKKEIPKEEKDQGMKVTFNNVVVNIFTSSPPPGSILPDKIICKKCAFDAIKGALEESLNRGEDGMKKPKAIPYMKG